MKNHFRLFDYTLDIIDEPLTKEIIINYYKILKRNTTTEENIKDNLEKDIDELLKEYNKLKKITIETIIDFYYQFECIHAFKDGNGPIGRMLCLKNV